MVNPQWGKKSGLYYCFLVFVTDVDRKNPTSVMIVKLTSYYLEPVIESLNYTLANNYLIILKM